MFKSSLNAILFSIAITVAAVVLGNAYVNRAKVESAIVVTGSGNIDFTSDLIVWSGSFSKENVNLKEASKALESDRKAIEKYLIANGIPTSDFVFNVIQTQERTKSNYTDDGKYMGDEFLGYSLTQSVEISSKDVNKVEAISRKITELLNEGISFYSEAPRYYYTKLADLKIELVSLATEDARMRAEKIAEKSGGALGDLIAAQMGIIQITGQNSTEEYAWGGTFNTSSREKSASITMKLSYEID